MVEILMAFAAADYCWMGQKSFKEIQYYLLGYQHNNPDHCPDGEITLTCDIHGQICGVMDSLS
jgi:hypothetical protein